MNKEDVLLKNYSILSKKAVKNAEPIKSIISQLCQDNPKLGMRCWLDMLQNNIEVIEKSINSEEFEYGSFGYVFITDLESDLVNKDFFKGAIGEFAKNKQLLEILYSKFPICDYCAVYYAIAYLIRNNRLQEANTILSSVYKNKSFKKYADLWQKIIDRFQYTDLDNYSGGGFYSESNYKQTNEIQEFCMSWAERIADEEEQAGAITHIMRIF